MFFCIEDRIRGASSLHESKMGFINVRGSYYNRASDVGLPHYVSIACVR